MSTLVNTNLGPVNVELSFTGGNLVGSAGDQALGISDSLNISGAAILAAINGALDAALPAEKTLIDLVMGVLSKAIVAIV